MRLWLFTACGDVYVIRAETETRAVALLLQDRPSAAENPRNLEATLLEQDGEEGVVLNFLG